MSRVRIAVLAANGGFGQSLGNGMLNLVALSRIVLVQNLDVAGLN
jgi:hypothetical protein